MKSVLIIPIYLLTLCSAINSFAVQKKIDNLNVPSNSPDKIILSQQRLKLRQQDFGALKALSSKNTKMGPVLESLIAKRGKTLVNYAGSQEDRIRLIINTTDEATTLDSALNKYNARVLNRRNGIIAIEALACNIERLVNETEAIKYSRLPAQLYPSAEMTVGADLMGATAFHNAGYIGSGVRIAIIDVGFKGIYEARLNSELPGNVTTRDFSDKGLDTEYRHGTACAELVYDITPGAELYLLKIFDEIDIYSAIDYCINNNIDIISISLAGFGTGPGNGTGAMDKAFSRARENGILVVAAAGNYADFESNGYIYGSHWEGEFYDSDNDGIHEFDKTDPDSFYNIFTASPKQNDDGNPVNGELNVLMRWNDWINRNIDYDIYLYEYDISKKEINFDNLVGYSNLVQNGVLDPMEQITIDLPDSEDYPHDYALVVKKKSGEPDGTDMEIYLGGASTFVPFNGRTSALTVSSSSMGEPADAEEVLAVGAVNFENWTNGPQEDFSSQGPTNAWAGSTARIKPDICGPDGVSTRTSGSNGFWGTSASTPQVAGVAALIKSLHPDYGPDEMAASIESNAIDMSIAGKDNIYGAGRIKLVLDSSTSDNDSGSSSGGGGGGSGCFIATAAYGSYFEPHVLILRQFRDDILLKSSMGRAFARLYYRVSPPMAEFITRHDALKVVIRWGLLPFVGISRIALILNEKRVLAVQISVFFFCAVIFLYLKRRKV